MENDNQEVEVQAEPVDEVQAKIDAAIMKAQEKWESDLKDKAKKEAELSKMSEDERAKAELENTRQELEKQRADFEREKLKYEAAKVLAQRNLPVEFVDYLLGGDNDTTLTNIKAFEKKFNKAVEDAVNNKLKGKAPQTGGQNLDKATSKSAFMKAIADAQIKY